MLPMATSILFWSVVYKIQNSIPYCMTMIVGWWDGDGDGEWVDRSKKLILTIFRSQNDVSKVGPGLLFR